MIFNRPVRGGRIRSVSLQVPAVPQFLLKCLVGVWILIISRQYWRGTAPKRTIKSRNSTGSMKKHRSAYDYYNRADCASTMKPRREFSLLSIQSLAA
ncbi:hypothetical protein Y1Q_0020044 [Alligator mississippiensis]|uniref:Uncharacterized protein n=1 Tax=Alligator mississippiensis TaxID=8496 RepID=A0A151LYU9_ALLMI|nr:hypothetical protein Y1Q_0020044 [Alligator mississippiensis]